jgi:hypothetical protein
VADHLCVTENIEGETGKNRMGKQRRLMNVAEKSPPQTSGNKHPFFPHRELSTEEPLAVEAHASIIFRSIRSCATYSRYLERRFVGARPIILSIDQSQVIPHRMLHIVSIEKLRPAQGTWL